MSNKQKEDKLTIREKAFCREYMKSCNGMQSAIKAGYAPKTADITACKLLRRGRVAKEIERLTAKREQKAIMDAQEVMELYTAVARGEIKDQFGLDASLADRLKAANEIAKRTVDLDNRLKGIPDQNNQLTINLNWRKKK